MATWYLFETIAVNRVLNTRDCIRSTDIYSTEYLDCTASTVAFTYILS